MQHIQEGSVCITRHLSNLGFVNQRLIEEIRGICLLSIFLLLIVCVTFCIFGLFLLRHRARDIKSHLHKLISSGCSFSASVPGAALFMSIYSIRSRFCTQVEFHCHFVSSSKIRVGDLGIWYLESRSVLHIESQFRLAKFCFTPIPASECMLPVLKVDTIPDLEAFAGSFEVLVVLAPSIHGLMISASSPPAQNHQAV